jgi:hypothetical protein
MTERHQEQVAGSYRELLGMLRRPGTRLPPAEALDRELARLLVEDDERIRRGDARLLPAALHEGEWRPAAGT